MASETRNFAATIPAGTAIATPATVDISFPPRLVRSIRWRVPIGAFGQVGFALASGGQIFLPVNKSGWIIANDEYDTVPIYGAIESGAWQLIGYNLGIYDHTVYLTFQMDTPGSGASALPLSPLVITP